MTKTPDLVALLGSRLCHDLISPIGAIGNGVELLMMEAGASPSPELALVNDSVAQANTRIRLFRLAFGQAGVGQRLGRAEVQGLLLDMGRGGRLAILAEGLGDLDRAQAKRLFLGLLCLESAFPWGGQVVIAQTPEGALTLAAQGKRVKPLPHLWPLVRGEAPPADLAAAEVHFAILGAELAGQGHVTMDETRIQLLL
ncbi:histidine phosphotransferase family protein [Neogemmobacter tilapiae]|uniref:Histidine phosphotransferase n=1 Tax=Neogemmobacter tilapiae TaxID=875041 RepID=A0A918WP04_9RHOB|nr:histidine phosphotransferase family protein [Gemmobacter tilapiae]GHC62821.1 histidine phosphotransferase [Gemmobacter tilapiae]